MKRNKKIERRLDLSSKFLQMGQALVNEGNKDKDFVITQSGTIMIFIAGLILEDDDMQEFTNLCSMFSSKKFLDSVKINDSDVFDILKNRANHESYDDIIKKINKLKNDDDTTKN